MQYDDDVEESVVKTVVPLKQQKLVEPIKPPTVLPEEDADEDDEDDDLDTAMLIERQSSNIENERDYLVMDEAPKAKGTKVDSEDKKEGD